MSNQKDGGPAFPRVFSKNGDFSDSPKYPAQEGMSLRDYFAAQAIAGMFSPGIWPNTTHIKTAADAAYIVADAMLAARGAS